MMYVPDALDMCHKHDAEKEQELMQLPVCKECGERIQTEYAYGENGDYICEDCLKNCYRVHTVDLMR